MPKTPQSEPRVAAVVPCYRETGAVLDVLGSIGPEVGHVFVVDDACPDSTGEHVRRNCTDPRVEVLSHHTNTGVGGAVMTGYRRALEVGAGLIVKLDGDGQMDPAMIPRLIAPLREGRADYAKGNRFHDLDGLGQMPKMRIGGNLALSFASKLSSGYWNVFDPTNGFTAIHAAVVGRLPLDRISPGYFFESDMLFRLYLLRAVVVDVPMRARYGAERSGLNLWRACFEFTAKHCLNTAKRLAYTYFLRDFTAASVELVLGTALLLFGLVFGGLEWHQSVATGVPATAGTVLLAALPVILGSQFLIAFLDFDTRNVPETPLHPRL
jgi:glycosyltransferase involved in cell wall biosynthesis